MVEIQPIKSEILGMVWGMGFSGRNKGIIWDSWDINEMIYRWKCDNSSKNIHLAYNYHRISWAVRCCNQQHQDVWAVWVFFHGVSDNRPMWIGNGERNGPSFPNEISRGPNLLNLLRLILIYSLDWFVGENLNRKPMGFYHQIDRAFRLKFSHHPILCMICDKAI